MRPETKQLIEEIVKEKKLFNPPNHVSYPSFMSKDFMVKVMCMEVERCLTLIIEYPQVFLSEGVVMCSRPLAKELSEFIQYKLTTLK